MNKSSTSLMIKRFRPWLKSGARGRLDLVCCSWEESFFRDSCPDYPLVLWYMECSFRSAHLGSHEPPRGEAARRWREAR